MTDSPFNLAQFRAELKQEIKQEIRAELAALIRTEVANILPKINKKINDSFTNMQSDVRAANSEIRRDIANLQSNNSGALTLVQRQQQATEVASIVKKDIETSIFKKFDKIYGGELNKVVEWSNYQMQDTDDILDKYRKQVMNDDQKGNTKLLTDSKNRRNAITEHMSLVFGYDGNDY